MITNNLTYTMNYKAKKGITKQRKERIDNW